MTAGDTRGFAYTEQFRHECEVRFVLAMPTREARRAYVDSLVPWRGAAATQRLRDDVQAAWFARARTPAPCGPEEAAGAAHVHPAVNPGEGSFLALAHAGNSGPVDPVVSGVAAR